MSFNTKVRNSKHHRTPFLSLQQEGALCAQHCLNALLQGPFFTPVDLSNHAHALDAEERAHGARAAATASANMDDTGFFSVQVVLGPRRILEIENENHANQPGLQFQLKLF